MTACRGPLDGMARDLGLTLEHPAGAARALFSHPYLEQVERRLGHVSDHSTTSGRSLSTEAVERCGTAWFGPGCGSVGPLARGWRGVSPQAVFAIQWLCSLSMLCVAATNRSSDCAAALPLRMN